MPKRVSPDFFVLKKAPAIHHIGDGLPEERPSGQNLSLDLCASSKNNYGKTDCMLEDRPFAILRCAGAGKVSEVDRILKKDLTRLHIRNRQGQMPIHMAAQKGHRDVIQTLLDFKADINAIGSDGNTALHMAVAAGHVEVCGFLMASSANWSILNDDQMAALHLAADIGGLDVIKELVKYDMDVNLPGEQGMTALHFAAAKDNGDAMSIIIASGARLCTKNSHGFYPIHVAAQSAAASAMECIIEHAISAGYTREMVLSFKDRENNLPLHAAVNGGNIKAVEVCLKSGASVKVQQDDGSTPVHFASAQGNMQMMELMASMQKDNFLEAMFLQDASRMSPLHRAAYFDHTTIILYLLNHGSDIECKDINDSTPLLLAASKGCWSAVQILVAKGADVNVKDKNNRNFLHLAIRFGGKLEEIGADFIKDIKTLQNSKDDFGCTPVHYASREGHLLALDDLIRMGAVLNHKNNEKQSPLHFAAKFGRLNSCKRLLDSNHGPNIINETDGQGLTALHIAAENGHTKVIQVLLARGAVVNKDHEGNTALHHAAANGWTRSMRILIGVKANLLDMPNEDGDTALHIAAKNGQTSAVTLLLTMSASLRTNKEECTFYDYVIMFKNHEVAAAVITHDRWEEVLQLSSKPYQCAFLGLIQHLPDVCINVLDRCQEASSDDQRSSSYHVTYNFTYLERPQGVADCEKTTFDEEEIVPMKSLRTMVEFNKVNCLSHPVCVTFLKRKWAKYGCLIYAAYLFVYMVFLACLTSFVLSHDATKLLRSGGSDKASNSSLKMQGLEVRSKDEVLVFSIALWFIAVYSGCNVIKEIAQIFTQKMRYFVEFQNYMEWSLYVTSLMLSVPFLTNECHHWQWEAGAIAVFLAWFNCLVFLQRFDFFGIYVVMFLEILRTLIQVVCVFSILFLAFGISFYMLLNNEPSQAYSTPPLSILRTFTMMLELDYMASFNAMFVDGDKTTLPFGSLTMLLLVAFIFLMPILLMNLLIGLAVGDIESVQKDARLKRLAMQVDLHSDMEAKMPNFLFVRAAIFFYKDYPNRCKSKIQTVMGMISGNTAMMEASDRINMTDKYFCEEMYKQKVRMREMNGVLNKNYRLLRNIMQKMEIQTEDDAWDEGVCDYEYLGEDNPDDNPLDKRGNTRSLKSKDKMYLKSAVVSMWPRGKKS